MKVWIARDKESSAGDLNIFTEKPSWSGEWFYCSSGEDLEIDDDLFPEVKNGECFEAEITLGRKVSE